MARRRTDITRSDQVRTNSKQLAELMIYFSTQHGWRIESIGGFLRDLFENFHEIISQQEGFQTISGSAEAEEILQQFKTGRVNRFHLSLNVEQEEMGRPKDEYYRPKTKNPKRNERRKQRREMFNPTTVQPSTNSPVQFYSLLKEMPEHIREKYDGLPEDKKEWVNATIQYGGTSWEGIEKGIDEIYRQIQERNEEHHLKQQQTIKEAQENARLAGILVEENEPTNQQVCSKTPNNTNTNEADQNENSSNENSSGVVTGGENELVSSNENTREQVEQYRKKVDEQQLKEMKQQLKQPPTTPTSTKNSQ